MVTIGYVRVSAVDQNSGRQVEAVGTIDRLFVDHASGKDTHRPQLDALRAHMREGSDDVVRVKSVDRFARSTQDLRTFLQEFGSKGASVDFVDSPAFSISTPSDKFTLTVLAAVVEFERELIKERQREDIALAKVKGKYQRGPMLTPEQITEARCLIDEGEPKTRAVAQLGVSCWTLAGKGVYGEC